MADATEKLQKLKSAVDGLTEMSDLEKSLFISLASRYLSGERRVTRHIEKTHPPVSLHDLPDDDLSIETLLDKFAILKINESVEVHDVTMYDSNVPVIVISSMAAEHHTENILEGIRSTLEFHSISQTKYPCLGDDFMLWPGWYSPGDMLTPIHTSGLMARLLEQGREYVYISNADNAVVDLKILNHVIQNHMDFCMEVADSLDPSVASYNNLWINVKAFQKLMEAEGLELEIIPKFKEVDGVRILQLETDGGSAIKFFNNTIIIKVPPSRFQKLPHLDQDTLPRDLAPSANETVEYNEVQNNDFVDILASECAEADLLASMKEMEGESCVSLGYMDNREDISKFRREGLINWVIRLHEKLKLKEESLHLSVQIIDRFFAVHKAEEGNLREVGAAALSLASKFEDKRFHTKSLMVKEETYTLEEVIAQELLMARTLNFRFCFPIPYTFMRLFRHATNSEIQIEPVSLFFIELCLFEFEMVEQRPSMLAASAMYAAQCTMNRREDATTLVTLSILTDYTEDAIEELARNMVRLHQKFAKRSWPDEHHLHTFACRLKPALFLLT